MSSIEMKNVSQAAVLSTDHRTEEGEAITRRHGSEVLNSQKSAGDEDVLARFGKKQRLKRRFNSLSSIGLISGIMISWAAVLFGLQYGLINGGPAGLVYGYLAAWFGAMMQALVMAEMASMIPLAGGPFNWVAILAPPSCRKFLSYMAGWLSLINWQALVAAVSYASASQVQGLVILNNPQYEPKLWHATLMSYAVSLFGLFVNTYLGRILPRIEATLLIFYLCAFFGVLIPLAYLAPHRSAHEVFTVFQNLGGWSSMGLSFFVGWTTSVSSFLGGDGSDHIAEEIQNAAKVIPFSIWASTLLNGALGFAMLLTVVFCISDIVKESSSITGYPFIDIFAHALGSNGAGTGLAVLLVMINCFSITSTMATASRMLWAFAREGAVPFSHRLVKVHPTTRLPLNAIFVTLVINMLLALISVGSTLAYFALFSVVLSGYFSAFMVAAGVMLHKRLTTQSDEINWGPFRLGRTGVPVTIIAIAYSLIGMFFSMWPLFAEVTPEGMNYASLVFGIALILSLGFWFSYGRKVYTGPIWEF